MVRSEDTNNAKPSQFCPCCFNFLEDVTVIPVFVFYSLGGIRDKGFEQFRGSGRSRAWVFLQGIFAGSPTRGR